MQGYTDGNVRPDAGISRAELAILAVREAAYQGVVLPPPEERLFTDLAEIPDWALSAIRLAANADLMQGFPDGSFRAPATATRAQAAVLVVRIRDQVGR